jgi:hypothetical protein
VGIVLFEDSEAQVRLIDLEVVLIGAEDAKYGAHFADVTRVRSRHIYASLLEPRVF